LRWRAPVGWADHKDMIDQLNLAISVFESLTYPGSVYKKTGIFDPVFEGRDV
jgi:hypothetical protein